MPAPRACVRGQRPRNSPESRLRWRGRLSLVPRVSFSFAAKLRYWAEHPPAAPPSAVRRADPPAQVGRRHRWPQHTRTAASAMSDSGRAERQPGRAPRWPGTGCSMESETRITAEVARYRDKNTTEYPEIKHTHPTQKQTNKKFRGIFLCLLNCKCTSLFWFQ